MALTRRRFLTIASAACLAAPALPASAQTYRWHGIALGANAQILLDHPDAAAIVAAAQAEITRLERVFSLYLPDSDLVRLNQTGRLDAPAFELLDCLAIARRAHSLTEGRFDPTIQPLWQVAARAAAQGVAPVAADLDRATKLIGFDRLRFDSAAVVLDQGQALTLNGIAQGYIADRVAGLIRARGIADVLIDTGEISALGHAPERQGWPITIAGEAAPRMFRNRALATSALMGTVLDADGAQGHILDPRDGSLRPRGPKQVSVSAPQAAMADALSTGLSLVEQRADAARLLDSSPEARLESFVI